MLILRKIISSILILSILLIQPINAQDTANAIRIKGTFQSQSKNSSDWNNVNNSRTVISGDSVRTLDDSEGKVVFSDGSGVKLFEKTNMTIKSYSKQGNQKNSFLHLLFGKIIITVQTLVGGSSSFKVETPSSIASVRGTKFEMAVNSYRSETNGDSKYKITSSGSYGSGPGDEGGKVNNQANNQVNDKEEFKMDVPDDEDNDKPDIPEIERILPEEGKAGREITIEGLHFSGVVAVEISKDEDKNYITLNKFRIINDKEIKLFIPPGLEREEYYIRLVVTGKNTYVNVLEGTVSVTSLTTGKVKDLTPKDGPTTVGPEGIEPLDEGMSTAAKIGIAGAIAAGVLIAIGLSGDDDEIKITSPQDKATVSSSRIRVEGNVSENIKYVKITANNGNSTSVTVNNSNFSGLIRLSSGENKITVEGFETNGGNKLASTELTVFFQPYLK